MSKGGVSLRFRRRFVGCALLVVYRGTLCPRPPFPASVTAPRRRPIRVLCCCEDVGVMSAAILDIEEDLDLSPLQAEVLVGSLNVIAAFGGLIAGIARGVS